MRVFSVLFFCALLSVSLMARSELYQSTGEDGSVVFSDQPTPDSKKVDVPEPNVGDSVEVPPPTPEPKPEPKPEPSAQELPDNLEGDLVGYEKRKKKKGKRRYRRVNPHI